MAERSPRITKGMDLSQLTDAELSTLKTNLLASINASASGAQSYQIGVRQLSRMDPEKAMKMLGDVNREIRLRASGGDDLILAELGEAS